MVVAIQQFGKDDSMEERLVECDKVTKRKDQEGIGIILYRDDKIVLDEYLTEKTKIFIMEKGKTIDRMEFKINN